MRRAFNDLIPSDTAMDHSAAGIRHSYRSPESFITLAQTFNVNNIPSSSDVVYAVSAKWWCRATHERVKLGSFQEPRPQRLEESREEGSGKERPYQQGEKDHGQSGVMTSGGLSSLRSPSDYKSRH